MAKIMKKEQGSTIALQKYLGAVDYPTDKQGLLSRAKEKGAPKLVLGLFNALPNREFRSAADVAEDIRGR
jgi:hypothetical protein